MMGQHYPILSNDTLKQYYQGLQRINIILEDSIAILSFDTELQYYLRVLVINYIVVYW